MRWVIVSTRTLTRTRTLIRFLERLNRQLESYVNRIENYEERFEDDWDIVEQLNRLRETLTDAQGIIEELLGSLEEY